MWDLLVSETNRYAAQQRQQDTTPGRPWHDVTVEGMKAFAGMQILMGICKLPPSLCTGPSTIFSLQVYKASCLSLGSGSPKPVNTYAVYIYTPMGRCKMAQVHWALYLIRKEWFDKRYFSSQLV